MSAGLPKLVLRNVMRTRLRTTFMAIALALTVTALVLIQAVQTAWNNTSSNAPPDRLTTQDSVSYAVLLPKHYAEEVSQVRNVKVATYYNWLGARDPLHETEFFPTVAVDPLHYFDVYSEIVLDQGARTSWKEKRDAAVVGELLAAKLGWKVGDRVSLETGLYPEQPVWSFEIVGLYGVKGMSLNRSSVMVRWDYFNELAGEWHNDKIGWIVTTLDDPARSADVASAIDAHFRHRGQPTFTQSQQAFLSSFASGMSMMMQALSLASAALLAIMVLLVGNTIAMGVRERIREYGTLRAIGFRPWHIAGSIVAEASLLGALGGTLGLALSYPLVDRGLGRWIGRNMDAFLPYFEIGAETAVSAFAASTLVAALAASLPAYRMFNLSVTEALRRVG